MGIVKISDPLHDQLRTASEALSRSINAQAEHWLRVGMLAETHPSLTYVEICQRLLDAARTGEALAFGRPDEPEAAAAAAETAATMTARRVIRRAAR